MRGSGFEEHEFCHIHSLQGGGGVGLRIITGAIQNFYSLNIHFYS